MPLLFPSTPPSAASGPALPGVLSRIWRGLRRTLAALFGLTLLLVSLAVALVLALGLLLFSLLRGRRPTLSGGFPGWGRFRPTAGAGPVWMRPGPRGARAPATEVVDIEAREVPDRR